MTKLFKNQRGVTLIETVAATAIVAIILITILGALLFSQKMIIFSDEKNNAASICQEQIDGMMAGVSSGVIPVAGLTTVSGYKIETGVEAVDKNGDGKVEGYDLIIKTFYNNEESYVELKAYAKKDGVKL